MTTSGVAGTGTPPGRPSGISNDKKDQAVLTEMLSRFSNAQSYEAENRENYIHDTEFSCSNDQWDENVKVLRGKHRPALTFNRLNGIVKQVIGDYRQNKLAIKVIPSGSGADEEKADILAGIIRGIEIDSNADMVYVNGLECSVRGGFGWFRLLPEYESDESFNQKLMIRPIHNPLTVYCDPAARLLDRSDARWMIVTEKMPKDEFKASYPDASTSITDSLDSDLTDDWGDDEEIRIAEYFTKEKIKVRLAAFDNGAVVEIDEDEEIETLEQIGWKLVKEREAERTQVRWRKCTASEILEEQLYKTQYIPLIPVIGEEVNLQGKVHLRSLIYYAKDAQRMDNYWKTAATESVALVSKAPWMGTAKHFEGFEDIWDRANSMPVTRLVYNVDSDAPQGPIRVEPPGQPIGEMAMSSMASQDIQYTTGVFDATLGQRSNAVSGIAESERQNQSATNTYIPVDNLRKSIEHCGRIIIDWLPEYYDTERIVRIVGMEGDTDTQTINEQQPNPLLGVTEVLNDITVGKYDVVVEAGPAFASRRREAVDGMLKFAQAMPQEASLISDLLVKNMDWPGADEVAARLKRALPPQITIDPDSPEGKQMAQQAQAQQQQQQQMQQQAMQSHIQIEQGKNQAEMAKSNASVVKSQAEVVKAKADVIEAVHGTKETESLDNDRMNAAPQTNANGIQMHIIKSPEDLQRDSMHSNEMKQALTGLAQHIAASQDMNHQHNAKIHEVLGHLANGQNAIASAIHNQAQIAAAPTEAIRDKGGRMVGSRKILPQAHA